MFSPNSVTKYLSSKGSEPATSCERDQDANHNASKTHERDGALTVFSVKVFKQLNKLVFMYYQEIIVLILGTCTIIS